jgi:hypothetical protein
MPAKYCMECGHPIHGTIDPFATRPRQHSHGDPVIASGPGLVVQDEDTAKVQGLLNDIAAQSHFEERYQVRGELACGGMGQVYRAYDQILRRSNSRRALDSLKKLVLLKCFS